MLRSMAPHQYEHGQHKVDAVGYKNIRKGKLRVGMDRGVKVDLGGVLKRSGKGKCDLNIL